MTQDKDILHFLEITLMKMSDYSDLKEFKETLGITDSNLDTVVKMIQEQLEKARATYPENEILTKEQLAEFVQQYVTGLFTGFQQAQMQILNGPPNMLLLQLLKVARSIDGNLEKICRRFNIE